MIVRQNNYITQYFVPRYVNKEIIVAIDSSKTNTGIVIGDSAGNVLDYYDLNGEQDGTTEEDVLHLCKSHRECLSQLLKGSKPIIVGIENIITVDKHGAGKRSGISIHMSRFKITAVFMSFITFFQDTFGITPQLINNQTWKATVLPPEFRKEIYDKGSLAYFKSINSKYQHCTDDVTDALCILKYLCIKNGVQAGRRIESKECRKCNYKQIVVSKSRVISYDEIRFLYNPDLTFTETAIYIANRLVDKEIGVVDIPINVLSIDEIYSNARGDFREIENVIKLVVQRT